MLLLTFKNQGATCILNAMQVLCAIMRNAVKSSDWQVFGLIFHSLHKH